MANTEENKQEHSDSQFMVQRIYIKDLSFEAPNTPAEFTKKWEPHLKLDINSTSNKLEENVYEVVLTVTATVENQKATAFLVEVKQAGIFTIQGAPENQLDHLLNSFCPSILYPYAREAISSQVMRGSFPQLVLAPVNFDALYMQQIADKQNQAKDKVETH